MAQSTISKPSTYSITELLTFGTYNTVDQTYNLLDSIRNYDALSIRASSDTNLATGGGLAIHILPTAYISSTNQIGVTYCLNGKLNHIVVTFPTNTTMKIVSKYDLINKNSNVDSGIRAIWGIRY